MSQDLSQRIKTTIDSEPVVLFMKGTPQQVLCGNSARALEALRSAGAPITAVDVLPDPAIRQELTAISSWPTIPQVFVHGELIGGADIVEELAQTGELRQKLDDELGESRDAGAEKVVAVTDGSNPFRLVG
ncbi:MAG TPA: glutaredoxin domain-containing protein [Gaiellaceae bacterium]|jgi:monothiol glutaredoxin